MLNALWRSLAKVWLGPSYLDEKYEHLWKGRPLDRFGDYVVSAPLPPPADLEDAHQDSLEYWQLAVLPTVQSERASQRSITYFKSIRRSSL